MRSCAAPAGAVLSVGVLGALWGASRGVRSIIVALNVVYAVQRARPWWRGQLVTMCLTVAFSVLALGGLLLLIFGERLGGLLAGWTGLGVPFATVWSIAQWPVILVSLVLGLDLVYYLAPAARLRWEWLTPGAAVALVGWVAESLGLRLYVGHFGRFNATYGSIGGVILLLLWLYVTGVALLVGAEINAVIARATSEAHRRAGRDAAPAESSDQKPGASRSGVRSLVT